MAQVSPNVHEYLSLFFIQFVRLFCVPNIHFYNFHEIQFDLIQTLFYKNVCCLNKILNMVRFVKYACKIWMRLIASYDMVHRYI
jgi:hypothetical protein